MQEKLQPERAADQNQVCVRDKNQVSAREVADTLKHTPRIRNGQVSDFMRVNRIYYLSSAKTGYERLRRLLDEGVRNGWVCDDSIRTEIARLGKIVDSGGRR